MSSLSIKQESPPIDSCTICLEEMTPTEIQKNETTELKCSHIFHTLCINPWLKVNNTCPICRNIEKPLSSIEEEVSPESPLSWASLSRRPQFFITPTNALNNNSSLFPDSMSHRRH